MRVLLGCLVVVVLAAHTLPYLVRDQLVIWLRDSGAETASLRAIDLAWLSGKVSIDSLSAVAENRRLVLDELAVDIDYRALFDQQIAIEQLSVSGLDLTLDTVQKGLVVGPISLPESESTAEPSEPSNWQLGLDKLALEKLAISYRDDKGEQRLTINSASLQQLQQWQPQLPMAFALQGQLNGSPLQLDSKGTPFASGRQTNLALKLEDFPLDSLKGFLPGLSGRLNADLKVDLQQQQQQLALTHQGKLGLQQLAIGGAQLAQLDWQGKGDFSLNNNLPEKLSIDGQLSLAAPQLLVAKDSQLGLEKGLWQGQVSVEFGESEQLSLAINQQLTVSGLSNKAADLAVAVKQLKLSGASQVSLTAGQPQSVSLPNTISVSGLTLQQPQMQLSGDSIKLNSQSGMLSFSDGLPSQLALAGQLSLQALAVNQGEQQISLASSKIALPSALKLDFSKGLPKQLSAGPNIDASALKLVAPGVDLAVAQLSSKSQAPLAIGFNQGQPTSIALSPSIALTQLSLAASGAKVAAANLSLSAAERWQLKLQQGKPQSLNANYQLAVKGAEVKQADLALRTGLTSSGPLQLAWQGETVRVSGRPKLALNSLQLDQGPLALKGQSIKLSAQLDGLTPQSPDIGQFELSVSGVGARQKSANIELARLASLQLNGAMRGQQLSIAAADAAKLVLLPLGKSYALAVRSAKLRSLQLEPGKLVEAKSLALSGVNGGVTIDKRGNITAVQRLERALKGLGSGGSSEPGPSPRIKVGSVSLSGAIAVRDNSVKPNFKSRVVINSLTARNLDSASKRLSPVALKARINDSANLTLEAQVAPFSQPLAASWKANLENLSLPVLSPYAGKFAGYFLDSGKLNLASKGSIKSEQLSGENAIAIAQLEVRTAETAATSSADQSLGMPLGMALSILEDDEGNIDLDIPLSGSLQDPNFGLGSVLEIIAEKGVKQAAMGFLTKALQPYGALISLASMAMDAEQSGSFITLGPVQFKPADQTVSKDMKGYLGKVAGMLASREGLNLKLCGHAVQQDRALLLAELQQQAVAAGQPSEPELLEEPLKERMLALAKARGESVAKQLKSVGVAEQRIFQCFPKLSLEDAKLAPLVSLGL